MAWSQETPGERFVFTGSSGSRGRRVNPLIAIALGIGFGGERVSVITWAAAAIIVAGIVIVITTRRSGAAPAKC